MIKPSHTKVVFFLVLLISFSVRHLNAQVLPQDTIKKAKTDSLPVEQFSDELESQVTYSAEDSIVSLPSSGKVYLYGKARVVYGGVEMEADVIEIDYQTNVMSAYGRKDSTGKLTGTPVFKEGSQPPMEAEKIMFNLKTSRGKIFNAMTKQGELLVIGNEIKKDSNNVVYMRNMRCIPCEEKDARTAFVASRAKVIPDDKIVTGPMYLQIGGIATPLGLPFGYFPNTKKQHNGILLPTFGNSKQFGFNLQNGGFYWGISDKTNMIIRGDIYANGSFGLNVTNNYKVLYKASGSTFFSYNRFNVGDRDVRSTYSQRSAVAVRWLHTQDNKFNPSVTFRANVNYQSNQNLNRLTAASGDQFFQNQFFSNITLSKSFKNSLLTLTGRQEQNTQTREINIALPELTYYVNSFFPFKNSAHVRQTAIDKIRLSYRLETSSNLRGADSTLFKGDWTQNIRYGLRHSIPVSTNFNLFKFITVTPQLDLSSVVTPNTISKTTVYENIGSRDGERDSLAPVVKTNTLQGLAMGYDARFSTSFNTKVYFDYVFRKGNLRQIRHLMIPSVNYAYRPDFGAEQFGFWKQVQLDSLGRKGYYSAFENSVYGGPDRGKTNSIGLSLSNNVEAKIRQRTDTGTSFVKTKILQDLTLSTNYNFAADSMKMQVISASARTTLFKYFNILAGSTFDPYAWDHTLGRRVSTFSYAKGQGVARWVNGNIAINTGIGSSIIESWRSKKSKNNNPDKKNVPSAPLSPSLAWNLSIAYRLDLTNINDRKLQPAHTLQLGGNFMPTKYWNVFVSTGFNFETMVFSRTQFTVTRDLKCWTARIEWVPFGVGKRYEVGINLKSSMLSDLRIVRRNAWFDAVR